MALGNLGEHRRLTKKVSELKVDFGPGYRVYFTKRGPVLMILCVVVTNVRKTQTSGKP